MGLVTRSFTYSAGAIIVASQHNDNENTLYNLVNGNISTANISASAGIVDTQLASITTAGKVNASALTITSQAQGDILYASGASTWTRLAKGTASQILLMNSGATAPEWGSLTASNALAGSSFNVVRVSDATQTTYTPSTGFPVDNTKPTWAEGSEIAPLEITITPQRIGDRICGRAVVALSRNTGNGGFVHLAVYKNPTGTDECIGGQKFAHVNESSGVRQPCFIVLEWDEIASSLDEITYKFRASASATNSFDYNRDSGGANYNGTIISKVACWEEKVA